MAYDLNFVVIVLPIHLRIDAEAGCACEDQSLHPIRHRSREMRQDLVVLRAREALVAARTELINATRGLVKSMGGCVKLSV